jgi:GntR family transcriptional regulator of arabinose operon
MARYQEIMEDIRDTIKEKSFAFGDRLPSEREFAGKYRVSSKTIKSALRELQYRGVIFRVNGRGTFVGKAVLKTITGTMVCLIPNLLYTGYNHKIMGAVEEECLKNQVNFIYMATSNSYEKAVVHIHNLEAMDLAGVVFTPLVGIDSKHNKNLLNMLKKKTGNLILLDAKIPGKNTYSFVGNENVGTAFKLTELLIKNKYESYIFIANTDNTAVQERKKGFMNALASYHIEKEDIHQLKLPFSGVIEGTEKIDVIMKKRGSLGIFAVNDGIACDLFQKIREKKYLIPKQIGITGFGGTFSAGTISLTTARMDFPRMAREIIKLLKSNGNRSIVVPAKIIRGKTT